MSPNEVHCSSRSGPAPPDRRFRPFFLDNPLRRFFSPPRSLLEGHLRRGMVVADLGCGPGYITIPAAEMVGPEGKVYGVDADEKSIAILQEKAVRKALNGVIESHVSSAASLPFIHDGTVDVVIAKGLICCMLDHEGALREIHRIIKPDAEAFFSVTKLGSKTDRRMVGKEEWSGMLSTFDVQDGGEGWTNRWAWVRAISTET